MADHTKVDHEGGKITQIHDENSLNVSEQDGLIEKEQQAIQEEIVEGKPAIYDISRTFTRQHQAEAVGPASPRNEESE